MKKIISGINAMIMFVSMIIVSITMITNLGLNLGILMQENTIQLALVVLMFVVSAILFAKVTEHKNDSDAIMAMFISNIIYWCTLALVVFMMTGFIKLGYQFTYGDVFVYSHLFGLIFGGIYLYGLENKPKKVEKSQEA